MDEIIRNCCKSFCLLGESKKMSDERKDSSLLLFSKLYKDWSALLAGAIEYTEFASTEE